MLLRVNRRPTGSILRLQRRPMRMGMARLQSCFAQRQRLRPYTPTAIWLLLGGVRSTKENIEEAIGGETYEFTKMYPAMIEGAKSEGNNKALRSFENANSVESIHASLYQKALDNLGNNEDVDYLVCQICGNTVEGEAPDKCPICGGPASGFMRIS